jgi:hypothetical protein
LGRYHWIGRGSPISFFLLITLTYIPFCILFAWLNAKWIEKNKRIYHGINGAIHIIAAGAFAYYTEWYNFLTTLLIARLFFDVSLNLFRGLRINYVPLNPKSIVDKLEQKVFGKDGYTPKIIYLVLIISIFIYELV